MKYFKLILLSLFLLLLAIIVTPSLAKQFQVTRLNNGQPIISSSLFLLDGEPSAEGLNINGPSVIRIPEWIPKSKRASPTAKYYLYFAHHKGLYLRMAWAENIEGPWQLYKTGKGVQWGDRGVLDLGETRKLEIGNGLAIRRHIASPDVHVDNKNMRIILYFHAPAMLYKDRVRGQKSFVATSSWGLDFSQGIEPVILGSSYFRVFKHNGGLYALSSGGSLHKALSFVEPWWYGNGFDSSQSLWMEQKLVMPKRNGINLDKKLFRIRHLSFYKKNSVLYTFFTIIGDSPERIFMSTINLVSPDWKKWIFSSSVEVLRAEKAWEGVNVSPAPSIRGPAKQFSNQLRDPFVFEDNGAVYLFYVGGGESSIGLSSITINKK